MQLGKDLLEIPSQYPLAWSTTVVNEASMQVCTDYPNFTPTLCSVCKWVSFYSGGKTVLQLDEAGNVKSLLGLCQLNE